MFLKDSSNFNVATANTLATARTINGTSFNGSGNITTANWGTARTLTVGNTGKSVNGSGNISWSLSEIGAVPVAGGTMNSTLHFNVNTGVNAITFKGSAANSMIRKVTDQGGLLVASDSSLFLHAGDNSTTIAADAGAAAALTSENLNLMADGNINLAVNTQSGYASATKFTINTSGFSGNAATATKLQTARTINGVSFDGSANITIPIASHNHDSNYLKTSGTSTLSGNISVDVASERVIKTTGNVGYFFNSSRIGMYDWTNQRDVFAFNPSTNQLALGSSSITTKVNGTFYGINNIALARGGLWLSATGTTTTCDYLRFGTNILASDDNKMTYLIDTGGSRATLDAGDVRATHFRLTNTGYPSIKFSDNVRIEYDAAGDTLYAAGTKSSHSGFREFRATQCNSTVNAIIAGKRLFIQSGTPSGVATGDVWIQV